MANLIIKPTSGGSLILQDEGGTAAHTIDASGNHTLSGTTNNIGTVTGGTYNSTLGTSATFPAGHVVQTTADVSAGTETTVSSSNNTWGDTVVTGAITPKYSNSAIIVHCSFTAEVNDASNDVGFGCRFKRTASGIADSYPTGLSGHDSGNVHSQMYRNAHQYTQLIDTYAITWVDDNVSVADTAVTYTLQTAGYGLGANCKVGGTYNARWHIFFQEIKR